MRTLLGLVLCLAEPNVALCLAPECPLEAAVERTERAPPPKRLAPALEGLSACLGELGATARRGAALDRRRRAELLGASAPAECRAKDPNTPAKDVAAKCSMAPIVEPDSPALRHLDAGTYGFLVAAHRALLAQGGLSNAAKRLLMNAVLAGALEGEELR